jgi:ribonuclease HI
MTTWSEIPNIELYSDGGADPNPGKGGFGVILSYKGRSKEFHQGYQLTTNNRMELMGVIFGLEQLKTKSNVQVFTDSQYVINGITKGWAVKWKQNNWYRKKTEKAINSDLWDRLLNEVAKHNVEFNWVKGHSGHPENERCDTLATLALSSNELIVDTGFKLAETTFNETVTSQTSISKKSKIKIINEGDICRNCGVPVIKKSPSKRKIKPNQEYYYEFYLYCPSCKNMYLVDEAKRFIT